MRILLSSAVALLVLTGGLSAADIKGKITKIDADKGQITVKVDGKEMEFVVPADAKCACPFDKELPAGLKTELRIQSNGQVTLKRLFVEGATVKITTSTKDGKDLVTKVQCCIE
jgi:hypothetical protein